MAGGKPQEPGQAHGSGRLSLEKGGAAGPDSGNSDGNHQLALTLDHPKGT
jgi:hypothetical protein